MEPIYIAAIISFAIGLFGYIVVRFWLLPIIRYNRIKGHLASAVKNLLDALQTDTIQNIQDGQMKDQQVSVRLYATKLASICRNELPYWYQLYLESRKERPEETVKSSMRLANTRNPEHALRQADNIKQLLRLK